MRNLVVLVEVSIGEGWVITGTVCCIIYHMLDIDPKIFHLIF